MNQFAYTENITKELFGDDPSLLIQFFSISNIESTDEVIRFTAGVNEIKKSIIFNGLEYFFIPHEANGFEVKNDGSATRPTLKIINLGGYMSNYIMGKNDLVGATVKRTRTFLKFLDAENFYQYDSNPDFWKNKGVNPDPDSRLMDEEWVINMKMTENKFFVEYELVSPLELENVFVPRRQIINNYCFWKYRGKGCAYSGAPIADANDTKWNGTLTNKGLWESGQSYSENDFVYLDLKEGNELRKVVYVCMENHDSSSDNKPSVNTQYWAADQCSKTLNACRARFAGDSTQQLPFGGFPGSRLY